MPDDVEAPAVEEKETDDRRADLEAAFDKAAVEPAEAPAAEAAPAEAAPETKPRDEKGRFAPGGIAPPAAPIGTPTPAPPVVAAPPPVKPPQSWKPEVRELVAKLPAEFAPILEEATRREKETAVALQRASETHRQMEPLLRAVQPYVQGLQQRGQSADVVIGNMLRTEQALSNPDVNVRARIIAEALSTYRVPVDVLAAVLDGTQPPAQGHTTQSIDPQQLIAQAKESLRAELEQARMQQATVSATQEIETFQASAEFFEDVRATAAAILEANAQRGIVTTLQDAYEQACWADPKIRSIRQQREASKQVANVQASTQRAKVASSSVRSTPGGTATNGGPTGDSWREHLEAAWDKAAGS